MHCQQTIICALSTNYYLCTVNKILIVHCQQTLSCALSTIYELCTRLVFNDITLTDKKNSGHKTTKPGTEDKKNSKVTLAIPHRIFENFSSTFVLILAKSKILGT